MSKVSMDDLSTFFGAFKRLQRTFEDRWLTVDRRNHNLNAEAAALMFSERSITLGLAGIAASVDLLYSCVDPDNHGAMNAHILALFDKMKSESAEIFGRHMAQGEARLREMQKDAPPEIVRIMEMVERDEIT